MRTTQLAPLLALIAFGAGCAAVDGPDCSVTITDTSIDGNTMTVDGSFITAQPLLVLKKGATTQIIAGVDDGKGHATFDLKGLPAGTWDYSFDASCYNDKDKKHVDAPTGFFTR